MGSMNSESALVLFPVGMTRLSVLPGRYSASRGLRPSVSTSASGHAIELAMRPHVHERLAGLDPQ